MSFTPSFEAIATEQDYQRVSDNLTRWFCLALVSRMQPESLRDVSEYLIDTYSFNSINPTLLYPAIGSLEIEVAGIDIVVRPDLVLGD